MAVQSMLIFISLICMAGFHVLVLVRVISILPSPQSTIVGHDYIRIIQDYSVY